MMCQMCGNPKWHHWAIVPGNEVILTSDGPKRRGARVRVCLACGEQWDQHKDLIYVEW